MRLFVCVCVCACVKYKCVNGCVCVEYKRARLNACVHFVRAKDKSSYQHRRMAMAMALIMFCCFWCVVDLESLFRASWRLALVIYLHQLAKIT
jgi:hypothetical protein